MAKVRCPRCGSMEIHPHQRGYSAGSGLFGFWLLGPLGLLFGAGGGKVDIACLQCGKVWHPGWGREMAIRAVVYLLLAVVIGGFVWWFVEYDSRQQQQAQRQRINQEQTHRALEAKQQQNDQQVAAAAADRKRKEQETSRADIARGLEETKREALEAPQRAEEARRQREVVLREQQKAAAKVAESRRWRVWTVKGESLDARFQRQIAKTVYLLDRDGAEHAVDASSLSSEDRAWIRGGSWRQ